MTMPREPVPCTFCEHPYLKPCHGEDERCMNRLWAIKRGSEPAIPEKPAPEPAPSIEDLL